MSNPYNNEVIFNGHTLMSLKEDTVTPDKVLAGETFHDRSGAPQTGNLITHNVYDGLDSTSESDALSANQGRVLNDKYDALNSNFNNYRKWVLIGTQTTVTNFQIDKKYEEVMADCIFASGQHILFKGAFPPSDYVRQDTGFYYNNTACGSGAAVYDSNKKITIYNPYYAGTQTTYQSITLYAR